MSHEHLLVVEGILEIGDTDGAPYASDICVLAPGQKSYDVQPLDRQLDDAGIDGKRVRITVEVLPND